MPDFYIGSLDGFEFDKFTQQPEAHVPDEYFFVYSRIFLFGTHHLDAEITDGTPLFLPASVSPAWAAYARKQCEATDDPNVVSLPLSATHHYDNPVALAAKQDGIEHLRLPGVGAFYPYDWIVKECRQDERSRKLIAEFQDAFYIQAPVWWAAERRFQKPTAVAVDVCK